MSVLKDPQEGEPPLLAEVGGDPNIFLDVIPHAKAIGLHLKAVHKAYARVCVPYRPELVGNPQTGVIHGGVVTTALDNVMGMAVLCALTELCAVATLDLRIDYMRAAEPGRDILAEAQCYKLTRSVAFVRGAAYHEGMEDDAVAVTQATFMLTANRGWPAKAPIRTGNAL